MKILADWQRHAIPAYSTMLSSQKTKMFPQLPCCRSFNVFYPPFNSSAQPKNQKWHHKLSARAGTVCPVLKISPTITDKRRCAWGGTGLRAVRGKGHPS